jgi:hypothetical protein
MPRQPFAPLWKKHPGGNFSIGISPIGERPELETIIGKCLMAWPIAESELGLTLGQLLGIGNEAALAVFSTLRRSTAQREAISAAAEVTLVEQPKDLKLLTAMLDVHKSTEAERSALAHGHFGTFDLVPDIILWTTAADYVQLKAKLHLANMVDSEKVRDDLISRIFFYRKADLTKIYEDILFCAHMWPDAINWLRSRSPLREELYLRLCGQIRLKRVSA